MSWSYHEDESRERKEALRRKLAARVAKGEDLQVLQAPQGNQLTRTFWGKAWCRHLEEHSHHAHRLPRGRSYLRQGNVYNLAIEPGRVTAQVAGSSFYDVAVTIQPLPEDRWTDLKGECAGQVASLLDLLAGKLGEGVLRAITDPEHGLFPRGREIRFVCSCPDSADMCKHVAAVLYGVGVHLDSQPDLFFRLRSVDPTELLESAATDALKDAQGTDEALAGEDLSALFGIDLAGGSEESAQGVSTRSTGKKQEPGRKAAQAAAPAKAMVGPRKKAQPKPALKGTLGKTGKKPPAHPSSAMRKRR